MSNNKWQSRGQHGFTLVEIMVAMLVFSVVMMGVAGGIIQALKANKGNVTRDEALRLAEDELNRLKGQQFSTFGAPNLNATAWIAPAAAPTPVQVNIRGTNIPFQRLSQITDLATSGTAFKRIDVAVGWNDTGGAGGPVRAPTNRTRQVTLSTIIVRTD